MWDSNINNENEPYTYIQPLFAICFLLPSEVFPHRVIILSTSFFSLFRLSTLALPFYHFCSNKYFGTYFVIWVRIRNFLVLFVAKLERYCARKNKVNFISIQGVQLLQQDPRNIQPFRVPG